MKTAKELVEAGFKDWTIAGQIKRECEKIVNEARKEAIEECANYAERYLLHDVCQNDFGVKKSILSLIDELK